MTDHLFIVGGAETRIVRTAELLEDLKFIPVILSQHNNHPPSQKFFNLTLDYRDPNLSSIIRREFPAVSYSRRQEAR